MPQLRNKYRQNVQLNELSIETKCAKMKCWTVVRLRLYLNLPDNKNEEVVETKYAIENIFVLLDSFCITRAIDLSFLNLDHDKTS